MKRILENKTVYFLYDLCENVADAVIFSEHTKEELEEAIQKAKDSHPGEWQFEDILNELPDDCVVVTKWESGKIYY